MTYQGLINVVEVAGKDGFGWRFALLSGTGADRPWLAGNPTLKGKPAENMVDRGLP